MMSEFIKVNGGDLVPLKSVKRIREVTGEDRQSLSKLGGHVDAARFHTRLEFAGGRRSFASQAVSDYKDQGVGLVEIDEGAFIPADNIISARDLSDQDRKEISDKMGRPLRAEFVSRVETKAGSVLATVEAAKIMHRMAHPEFAA